MQITFTSSRFQIELFFVLFVLIILSACSPVQETPSTSDKTTLQNGNPIPSAPQVSVTFQVEVPVDTPPGQSITLNILDEVSGLLFNPQRYVMQAQDSTHYTISISRPIGSILTYRYGHQSPVLEEYTPDDKPVRYRFLRVDGVQTINDIVSRWSDTPFTGQTGWMQGVITDSQKGVGISGLLISCAGYQTTSPNDGSFRIENVPVGLHNLVAYAKDGEYSPFQQGAMIAQNTVTPVAFKMQKAPRVNLVFSAILPAETLPMAKVRLAGNLSQLGNTFSDLAGGASLHADKMPVLKSMPDGQYGVAMNLPAGTDIRYKYTLGDGFWNAERTAQGNIRIRQLITPSDNALIQDQVITWRDGQKMPMNFDFFLPSDISPKDVAIQFYAYVWSESIPVWHLAEKRWTYTLYSPLDILPDDFKHHFCYNGKCTGDQSP